MTLKQYLDGLLDKSVAVLGVGVSNRPLLRLLADAGVSVTAYDRRERAAMAEEAAELDALHIPLHCGEGYLAGLSADVIFRTPGMRPDLPEIAAAVAAGARLTSEMEAFFEVCPCPIIAITGSDGKTTTSTLISEILTRAGVTTHLGGNIGTPLLDISANFSPNDRAVVELSSFQLMTMRAAPDAAVVTNVEPNHLDIHRDMAEYAAAKRNIFAYQRPEQRVVLNLDNGITRGFIDEAKSGVMAFSKYLLPENRDGVFLSDGTIYVRQGG
jgi:UDP-N-acetylmuramoylalanine--D-glutamate ligase